jgi:hypothetical protein
MERVTLLKPFSFKVNNADVESTEVEFTEPLAKQSAEINAIKGAVNGAKQAMTKELTADIGENFDEIQNVVQAAKDAKKENETPEDEIQTLIDSVGFYIGYCKGPQLNEIDKAIRRLWTGGGMFFIYDGGKVCNTAMIENLPMKTFEALRQEYIGRFLS